MSSPFTDPLPLAEILKDSGIHPANLCKIPLHKASQCLKLASEQPEKLDLPLLHNTLLETMETLMFLLPQVDDETVAEIMDESIVCDLYDPYLTLLCTDTNLIANEQQKLAASSRAVATVLSILLQNHKVLTSLGSDLIDIFVRSFNSICDQKGIADATIQKSAVNYSVLITVLSHTLTLANADEIEKNGVSLSELFDSSLKLLVFADLQTCHLVSGLLLPLLITTRSCLERVDALWSFILQVRSGVLCVSSLNSDLILTVLCCFSDVFISYNVSSPFSSHFPRFVTEREGPVVDLRREHIFWSVIHEGLVSQDPLTRKRCMFLLRLVLVSMRCEKRGGGDGGSGGEVELMSEGWVFWWNVEFNDELETVWSNLVLILETMEEKQIHIVKPVKSYLKSIISATTKSVKGHSLLHLSWLMVALSRVFEHTEAKSIVRWGIQECLDMTLTNSPLLLPENWKYVFGQVLKVLNVSLIYHWDINGRREAPPTMALSLESFLSRFISSLPVEQRSIFLNQFLAAVQSINFVDVPLVFVTWSLSRLPPEGLLTSHALASIRSIILNGILTHKPSFRAATQSFLLMVTCQLTDFNAVTYKDVIQTLGSFRDTECLIIGTKSWNQAVSFFAQFCQARMNVDGTGIFKYLEMCLKEGLRGKRDSGLPSLSHVTRALVLLVEGESRNIRCLSSTGVTLQETVTHLLSPILEILSTAQERPYLPPEVVNNSLVVVKNIVKLLLQGWNLEECSRHGDLCGRDEISSCNVGVAMDTVGAVTETVYYVFYTCFKGTLGHTLDLSIARLFTGSKGDSTSPCLDHVISHLEVLEAVYLFMDHFGYSFQAHCSHTPLSIATRAAQILQGLLSSKSVELSARFLGAVSLLQWASSKIDPHTVAISSLCSITAGFPVRLMLVKEGGGGDGGGGGGGGDSSIGVASTSIGGGGGDSDDGGGGGGISNGVAGTSVGGGGDGGGDDSSSGVAGTSVGGGGDDDVGGNSGGVPGTSGGGGGSGGDDVGGNSGGGGGYDTFGRREERDWGSLVSHCYSTYWECLLMHLKWTTHYQNHREGQHNATSADSREELESDKGEVLVGSADALKFVQTSLDNLDMAGGGVGVVIESISLMIPKLLLISDGAFLHSCAEVMWPLVMELKNHQQPFWRSLRGYLSIVFHPQLLLESSSNPEILELEWECAKNFLEVGEAKTNVYNLLADHVIKVWSETMETIDLDMEGSDCGGGVSMRNLFSSLKAHIDMLLQMAIFSPIYKKNLRNMEDVDVFLEAVQESTFDSLKFNRCIESNAGVRVKVVTFLTALGRRYASCGGPCQSLFNDFFHSFVLHLLQQVEIVTSERKHYHVNTLTHRTKLRLLQTLLVTVQNITETTGEEICKSLLESLQSDNQHSVRYLMEWSVVYVFSRYPGLIEAHFYPLLGHNPTLKASRMCSLFTIAIHIGHDINPVGAKEAYYLRVIPAVLKWVGCFHCMARLYAQRALGRMWEDCEEEKLVSVLHHFFFVKELVEFMEVTGEGVKFSHKTKSNVFFSGIRASSDRNMETIFHTLPLLTGVMRDEVIPLKSFQTSFETLQGEWRNRKEDVLSWGVGMECCNPALLEALGTFQSLPSSNADGSDTRSLAHHFKSNGYLDGSTKLANLDSSSIANSDTGDVQKKITPLSNPSAIVKELFPRSSELLTSDKIKGECNGGSGLVIVASLISKIPNLGGLCRTCEIFSVQSLVVNSIDVIEEKQFQSVSVTSEKWVSLHEVKLHSLREYLVSMRRKGYAIVGMEQTMRSKCASSFKFLHKTVLVLGNEREGIPPQILHLLDECIEIPQFGTIRSLNVHISASILIWQYTKQHLIDPK